MNKNIDHAMLQEILEAPDSTIMPRIWERCKSILRKKETMPDVSFYGHKSTFHKNDRSGWKYIENKNSPFILSAHVDTVRKQSNQKARIITIHPTGNVITADEILGADDRAGVYGLLHILQTVPSELLPGLLFTDGEETGGSGMKAFCEEDFNMDHVKLIIALDRNGCGGYVYYNPLPESVQDYIEAFGFSNEHGSFNDIKILTDKTRIPSVNLGIGYHNQHSRYETLHLDEMMLCIERVKAILQHPIETRDLVPERKPFQYGRVYQWHSDEDHDFYGRYYLATTSTPEPKKICDVCKTHSWYIERHYDNADNPINCCMSCASAKQYTSQTVRHMIQHADKRKTRMQSRGKR